MPDAADAVTGQTTAGAVGTGSTSSLIASDRVEGTPVRRRSDGKKIGTIQRLMIEKQSGRVAYALMTVGGVVGVGTDQHTLPWNVLRYDTELDAYVVDLTDEQLQGAPRRAAEGPDPSFDRSWEEHVHGYFNSPSYWNEAAPTATHEAQTKP